MDGKQMDMALQKLGEYERSTRSVQDAFVLIEEIEKIIENNPFVKEAKNVYKLPKIKGHIEQKFGLPIESLTITNGEVLKEMNINNEEDK